MERLYRACIFLVALLLISKYGYAKDASTLHNEHQRYTAIIEDVIEVSDKGFRSIKYVVTWKGNKIIVPDANLYVQKSIGDELKFLVMWHELETENGSIKNLNFTALE